MIPDAKLKVSFEEMSLRGKQIIASQSEITYAIALEQVQRLKKISKVTPSSKKNREQL